MSKKIYIGNLPFTATNDEVEASFAQYGEVVSVRIVTDRDTGRPKGFCFVEMSDEGATEAIAALNGADYKGRTIVVSEARPQEPRTDRFERPQSYDRPSFGRR